MPPPWERTQLPKLPEKLPCPSSWEARPTWGCPWDLGVCPTCGDFLPWRQMCSGVWRLGVNNPPLPLGHQQGQGGVREIERYVPGDRCYSAPAVPMSIIPYPAIPRPSVSTVTYPGNPHKPGISSLWPTCSTRPRTSRSSPHRFHTLQSGLTFFMEHHFHFKNRY